MTDRLTLTRAFEGAGVESAAAERLATEIYDAIHDSVATKADLSRVEAGLRAELGKVQAGLRADLERVEAGLRADLEKVEAGLRADLERVEARLRADLAMLRNEMQAIEQRLDRRIDNMVTRLGALVVVVAGLLFAALHYWPPHS
jgi:chromosome segregation ATPase